MDLILLDTKSVFDEIKIPNKSLGIDPIKSYILRDSATGNLPLYSSHIATSGRMIQEFYSQGMTPIVSQNEDIEFLLQKKEQSGYFPIVAIEEDEIGMIFTAHRIKEFISAGIKDLIVYSTSLRSTKTIVFIQSMESFGAKVAVAVTNEDQFVFLKKNTSCVLANGAVFWIPSDYKEFISLNPASILSLRKLYPEMSILVDTEIFKPSDAAKAIYLGATGVILKEVLLETEECKGETIESGGILYKEIEKDLAAQIKGPVINTLVQFEQSIKTLMLLIGESDINKLKLSLTSTLD